MDWESCELGSSRKRSWSESNCCRLLQAKRFNKNTIFGSEDLKEEDDFSCVSDLIQATGDCDFSDGNRIRSYDGSLPDSTQKDVDDLLTSLLTESEIPNSFSVPETINSFNGNPRKMGCTSLYSGPTLMDVQSALSKTQRKEQSLSTTSISSSSTIFESLQIAKSTPFSNSINELFYTRLHRAKREAKYSFKVKCPKNGMEDGYKWRKYGQKAIKNSPYPRSYYRCTSPKCRAKKQVEKCVDDPHTLTITYEGLHLHFPYPPFQITQQPISSLHHQYINICGKVKTKKNDVLDHGYNASFNNDLMQSSESPTIVAAHQLLLEENDQCCEHFLLEENDQCCESLEFGVENSDKMYENTINVGDNGWHRDGLLEDIVPFELINPSYSSSSSSSSSP